MRILISFLLLSFTIGELSAQYFGRNKPRYRSFEYKRVETPHFDLHHYMDNPETLQWITEDLELWYDYHAKALGHEIPFKNPVIFYNNHADFQQTNAISGGIGVGTGGVTEGLKNRVVMPVTFSNQQTHQVLGHELVHAFQFNIILGGDSTSMQSLGNVPLWIIEGMAEYMSIGQIDPFTAMWMRNAILNDDIPSLEKMANPKYFPYRYGQAAWSFLAGTYGDDKLFPFLEESAKYGVPGGAIKTFGMNLENLSHQFESALKTYYDPFLRDKKESTIGKTLLSKDNSGRINVSPAISPNGRYVVYLSEKDLFSTDLFMSDTRTGKVIRKLSSLAKDSDLDNFNVLESAGTWSPNSKQFAFVGFKKGKNVMVIKDVESGDTKETFALDKVPAFTNPAWHPNGRDILITGSQEGQTDLYLVNIKSKRVTQLTDDRYSEVQATFNGDGTKIVFSYDKRSFTEGRTHGKYTYDLAIMDVSSRSIDILDIFHGAQNINPTYDHEDNIYFMSDHDGYRNMYRYMPESGKVLQMTDYLTGLSGIARYSPVLTAARRTDKVLFTHYYGEEYIIKQGKSTDLLNKEVDPSKIDFAAGTLPVVGINPQPTVSSNLNNIDDYATISDDQTKDVKYRPRFQLDYVGGGAGIGVTNSTFGNYTGLQGGIDLLFGDMVGNHQLFSQLALNGEIYDMGGRVNYINRTHQLAWGVGLSHIPTRVGGSTLPTVENIELNDGSSIQAIVDKQQLIRIFDDRLTIFAHYPFSTTLRLEGSGDVGHRGFRWDETTFYSVALQGANGQFFRGQTFGREREKVDTGDEVVVNQFYTIKKGLTGNFNVALVGDNSYNGLTSPLSGHRFRLSAEQNYGVDNYVGLLGDFRRYFWMKPFSLAVRGMGYLRYEEEVNSVYPLFIGQWGFVRGYDYYDSQAYFHPEQMLGSKLGLMSVELRLPFSGPKQLALIGSNVLFTDLALFFDGGVAFNDFSNFSDGEPIATTILDEFGRPMNVIQNLKPAFAKSVGLSVRVNLFGAMILEPYWAHNLQENGRVRFGLNILPGW